MEQMTLSRYCKIEIAPKFMELFFATWETKSRNTGSVKKVNNCLNK